MPNYKAANRMVLLDNHLATGTEADYTFTKDLDMKTKYREILIIINGSATAAFILEMLISAHTNYDFADLLQDVGVLGGSVGLDATQMTVLQAGVIDGAVPFHAKITIQLNDAVDKYEVQIQSGADHEGQEFINWRDETSETTISALKFQTSTSTWIAGTEISIYGIQR